MHTTYRRRLLPLLLVAVSSFEAHAATTSSIVLTSSPNPSIYGKVISLTATVTTGATGTVTFYDGATVLGTSYVVGGVASLSTPSLAAGVRRLAAYYGGDSNFSASTSVVVAHTVQAIGGSVLASKLYTPALSTYQAALAVADFNGDGKPDLVWAGLGGAGILPGNGNGTFQPSQTISNGVGSPGQQSLAIGDFNGDGKLDIALAQQHPLNVQILLGNGDGTFQTGPTLNVATIPWGLAAGDFNGDGHVDLLVMEPAKLSLYLGAGDGSFLPSVNLVTGTALMQVAVGDFNGDGKADLVVADSVVSGAGGVKVLSGNGDGTFQTPVLFNVVLASALLVADFDQDGLDDIAVGFSNAVEILMGTRDGSMRYNGTSTLPNYVNSLLAKGDFNGDGKIDLAAGIQTGGVVILLGDGAGDFGAGIQYPLSAQYPYTIIEGDLNGDGRTDIVVGEPPLGITILYGASGTMTLSGTSQNALLGNAFGSPLSVTISDTSGNPVSGVTVTYSAPSTGASVVLSGPTAVTNAAGVASVTATANNTVGNYFVSASAGMLTAQFSLSNSADVPTSLTAVSGTPQSAAAGMPFLAPLKVALKNSTGQPVSGSTISYYSGSGIHLAGTTATTDSSGLAQVWATAGTQPGTFTVTVSSGGLTVNFSLTVLTPVAVSLATSPNPSLFGQPVTLTASVPSGVSGTVTFYDATQVLGTATISGQSASRSTILLPSGARTVTARYSGDVSHPASRSNAVIQTVTAAPNSSFSFGSASPVGETYSVGGAPDAGVIGDFNGDGKADLAVGNALSSGAGSVSVLLGNGDGTFRSGIKNPLNGMAVSIATGDFNNDGKADLAVGVYGVGMVVLLGNGDGSMTVAATYPVGNVYSIVVTDLNRDGLADLVTLDYLSGTLKVLPGNGDGTFQPAIAYDAGGSYPSSLVAGDFNSDGVPDFALTHSGFTSVVNVLMGNPDGTLQPVQNIGVSFAAYNLAAGDFTGDGKLDLIAVGAESWSVLTGTSGGTFQPQAATWYSTWTNAPVVADFNGDGKLDVALIYGNSGTQGVLFLFGNGDGSFQAPVTYAGSSSYTIAGAGNFSGGGQADLALLDNVNHSAQLLLAPVPVLGISSSHTYYFWQGLIGASYVLTVTNNQSTATAGVISVTDTLPSSLTATAISGTGWNCDLPSLTCTRSDSLAAGGNYPPIILTVNVASNAPGQVVNSAFVSAGGLISATASDPTSITGSLNPTATTLTVSPSPANLGQSVTMTALVSSALIGVVVFYDGATVLGSSALSIASRSAAFTTNALPAGTRLLHAYYRGDGLDAPSNSPTVSLNVRAGSAQDFSALGGYAVTGNAYSIAAGDFNGDGKADLAIANGSGVSVLLGSGDATFQPPVNYTANTASRFVASGDLNGDGKTDLVTANPSTNNVTVFVSNGDGTFQAGVNYPAGASPYSAGIGDLDGDGIPDLAVPNYSSGTVTILLGNGDGTFRQFVTYPVGSGPYSVVIGDFNGDLKPDLAVTNSTGSVTILIAKGNGIFQPPASIAVGGVPVAIVAGDFNADGKLDLVAAGANGKNITILLGNGDGTFRAPVSYPAGGVPAALATGDFNGDGNLDVAVATGSGASKLLGNGDGSFLAPAIYSSGSSTTSLTVGDFNGDGKADMAVTTGNTGFTTLSQVSRAVSGSAANNVLIFEGAAPTPVVTTIQTNPTGLQFSVDGGALLTAPQALTLASGSHTLAVPTLEDGTAGTKYAFVSWSDGGGASHAINVGSVPVTYTANFKTQYQLVLNTASTAGGSVTPATGGIYDAGAAVPISAIPATGYSFAFWSGDLASTTNAQTVTMNGPRTITANFNNSCLTLSAVSASLPATGTSTPASCPDAAQASCGYYPESPAVVSINPSGACGNWTATSSNPAFLQIVSGASGAGAGVLAYSMLTNPHTTPRSSVITVASGAASSSFLVTEAGNPDNITYREVIALYEQLLGRDPDQGGFAFWLRVSSVGLGQMADDFLTSPEAFGTDFAVMAAYQAALGTPPTYAQFSAALALLRAHTQTVGGLFTSLLSPGYTAANLYQNLLSRQPLPNEVNAANAAGLTSWFQTLIGYPNSVSPVSSANNEFQSTGTFQIDHTNALYVRMLYYVILNRDPDQGGFNFWLGVANSESPGLLFQGNAGMNGRLVILGLGTPNEGFIGSPEFQGLFAN